MTKIEITVGWVPDEISQEHGLDDPFDLDREYGAGGWEYHGVVATATIDILGHTIELDSASLWGIVLYYGIDESIRKIHENDILLDLEASIYAEDDNLWLDTSDELRSIADSLWWHGAFNQEDRN